MKKTISLLSISISMLCLTKVGHAQVKVHSDGDVSIGTLTNDSDWSLKVYGSGHAFKTESNAGSYGLANEFKVYNTSAKAIAINNNGSNTATIYGDGYISCYALGQYSDERLKSDVRPLKNSLDRIMRLQGINYVMKAEIGEGLYKDELGFIAQEVEKIVPEVVSNREEMKGINYGRLVALLTEGIKEQQVMIEDLKAEVGQLQVLNLIASDVANGFGEESASTLGQNIPNPGLGSTMIPVFVDYKAGVAVVRFYDLTGKQVLKRELEGKGQQNIEISLGDLSSGRYLYTLYVDGKEVGSKSMVLLD